MPPIDALFVTDKARAFYREKLVESRVPEGLHEGLIRYLVDRIPTGHFLLAILTNDLKDACGRGDDENRYRLYDVVFFLHNYAPGGSWGSPDNVQTWLRPIRHSLADCDENCRQCVFCYKATGHSGCNKLCAHRFVNYPDGWPEDQ